MYVIQFRYYYLICKWLQSTFSFASSNMQHFKRKIYHLKVNLLHELYNSFLFYLSYKIDTYMIYFLIFVTTHIHTYSLNRPANLTHRKTVLQYLLYIAYLCIEYFQHTIVKGIKKINHLYLVNIIHCCRHVNLFIYQLCQFARHQPVH